MQPRAWIATGPPGRLAGVTIRISAMEPESTPGLVRVAVQAMTANGPIAESPLVEVDDSSWDEVSEMLVVSAADGWTIEDKSIPMLVHTEPRLPFHKRSEGREYHRQYQIDRRARIKAEKALALQQAA